jgi:hypothetical protein
MAPNSDLQQQGFFHVAASSFARFFRAATLSGLAAATLFFSEGSCAML